VGRVKQQRSCPRPSEPAYASRHITLPIQNPSTNIHSQYPTRFIRTAATHLRFVAAPSCLDSAIPSGTAGRPRVVRLPSFPRGLHAISTRTGRYGRATSFSEGTDLQDGLARAGWCDLRAEDLSSWVVRRVVEFALESFRFRAMRSVARDCEHVFAAREFDSHR
jgi:hypothetical protein